MKFRDGKRLEFWSEWKVGKNSPTGKITISEREEERKWILTLEIVTYLSSTWKLNEQAQDIKLLQSYICI